MRVRTVLEQEDLIGGAVSRDLLRVEGNMAADVDEHCRLRLVLLGLAFKVLERHAQVFLVAVDELHLGAGAHGGKRGRRERV